MDFQNGFRKEREEKHSGLVMQIKIKYVAYSSQGNHTGQLDSCNWLAGGRSTG